MRLHFTKMEGLGNDYVYVNCFKEKVEHPSELAVRVSDRHFGIGSDGLILIKPSEVADFKMDMYNADGTQSEMCGNGIRCVGKYVYDHGLTRKTSLSIVSCGKIKYLELTVEDGRVTKVRVNMGSPVLEAAEIPVVASQSPVVDTPIAVDGREYRMTCVSMGNPHAIVYVDEMIDDETMAKIGPLFEHHECFPRRVNTEFVKVLDRERVQMRVWERGTGETLACGTGACAVTVASILNGLTEDGITVELLGGNLEIFWNRKENVVYMTGPATTVFEGEIEI